MTKRKVFEQFLEENLDHAYRFAFTYTHDTAMAEDVVGDSVIKALRALHTLREESALKSWFFRIIINTAYTRLKQEQRTVSLEALSLPEEGQEDDYSDLSFFQMIEKLDERYRTILVLRFFEDMKLEEIAYVLDENISTVKTRLYKAIRLLKLEMEDLP